MKTSLNTIAIALFLLLLPLAQQAQTASCNDFCVTAVSNDSSTSNGGLITINMSGSGFVNYPYVSQVLDASNNVVATGNMNFFGQAGGMSQDYPVTGSNVNWSTFVGTIVFVYDSTTCYLSYPCVPASSISCNSFCATQITIDSLNFGAVLVSIVMTDSGFVNYPFVLEILDANNNVVANGNMFFFGHVGGTTQDYPASSNQTSWSNFTGTIVFVYDNDTCYLPYPCSTLSTVEPEDEVSFNLWPNPADQQLQVEFRAELQKAAIELFDLRGQCVKRWENVSGARIILETGELSAGTYFLQILSEEFNYAPQKVMITR